MHILPFSIAISNPRNPNDESERNVRLTLLPLTLMGSGIPYPHKDLTTLDVDVGGVIES